MKKQPGVNGNWVPVSMQERVHEAALPSVVALGTPALVQMQYAYSNGWGDRGWMLPAAIWIYGLMFWMISTGRQLFSAKRWEWTDEALEEKYRYWTDARRNSRRFWGHWWVRFPIGLLFLSYGVHTLGSKDFSLQWLSLILLMSAFVTPFVFVAELALLPLVIIAMFSYLAVIVAIPISVIIMMAALALLFTVMVVMARRGPKPPQRPKPEDAATATATASATESVNVEPAADVPGEPAQAPVAALPAPQPAEAPVGAQAVPEPAK